MPSFLSAISAIVIELEDAEKYWVCVAQREQYPSVFRILENGQALPNGSPLLKLQPFLDASGPRQLLRVGGRLRTAHHLSSEFRSPMILPAKHPVTELIISSEDRRCNHTVGTNHLLANLSCRFWIVKGRQAVKRHRYACCGCQRIWRKPLVPPMGVLPDFRTEGPLLAFSRAAVDFAGPFLVKRGRGRVQEKRYAAVFTCLQTRACHLEMVTSLDTEGFKMALARFCSRRGCPKLLVSDNGTNFVATERELREAVAALGQSSFAADVASRGIEWKFNPPCAPHFGGIFERVVRSVKQVLQTVLYKADLTEEELLTALVQAEGLINTRPLTAVPTDAEDIEPLTPLHFLVGHCDVSTALEGVTEEQVRVNPRHRWDCIQQLLRVVWKRWMKEIVVALNVTTKWHQQSQPINIGDIFMVLDDGLPRGRRPLGRVTATYPGRDGTVRVIDVKIKGKEYRRPVNRLVPLDVGPDSDKQSTAPTAAVRLDEVSQ